MNYRQSMVKRFWGFQSKHFPDWSAFLEEAPSSNRPPVFLKSQADLNVICNPNASQVEKQALYNLLTKRHRWFRSMTSSQALAQSVLGNLIIHNQVGLLADLKDDDGQSLFGEAALSTTSLTLEHNVDFLGEPMPTSLDGYICGNYRVAIECKLTEQEVGPCSRPLTKKKYCDGQYSAKPGRDGRCWLTSRGVEYWQHIPSLFPAWAADADHDPCPLKDNYQLVRNVLAACVRKGEPPSLSNGHAVLLYDARNPAFKSGGKGLAAFDATRAVLKRPEALRKCTWQAITVRIAESPAMKWLADELDAKYGFLEHS